MDKEPTGYAKIGCGIESDDPEDKRRGLICLEKHVEKYNDFKKSLQDKGKLDFESKYMLEKYDYAIDRLKDYFINGNSSINRLDANIFFFYIVSKYEKFKGRVKSIKP